jgi:hypothetical protein
MLENHESKAGVEVKEEKKAHCNCTPLQRSMGVGLLAGFASGVLYFVYENLCPETKNVIKTQVINIVKSHMPRLVPPANCCNPKE